MLLLLFLIFESASVSGVIPQKWTFGSCSTRPGHSQPVASVQFITIYDNASCTLPC